MNCKTYILRSRTELTSLRSHKRLLNKEQGKNLDPTIRGND